MNQNLKDEPRFFWIFDGTEERCSDGMVKSSVVLNFRLGQHQRDENLLHIKKKILGY
jgi:hypothetical protein